LLFAARCDEHTQEGRLLCHEAPMVSATAAVERDAACSSALARADSADCAGDPVVRTEDAGRATHGPHAAQRVDDVSLAGTAWDEREPASDVGSRPITGHRDSRCTAERPHPAEAVEHVAADP